MMLAKQLLVWCRTVSSIVGRAQFPSCRLELPCHFPFEDHVRVASLCMAFGARRAAAKLGFYLRTQDGSAFKAESYGWRSGSAGTCSAA